MNHPNRSWRRRLIESAGALPQNVVAAWLTILPAAPRASRALYLTRQTGCYADANRLAAWASGRRAVPEPVLALMRHEILMLLAGQDVADAIAPVLAAPTATATPRPVDAAAAAHRVASGRRGAP